MNNFVATRQTMMNRFRANQKVQNYGNFLSRIRLQGFRCHNDTLIEFQSPVTAICGLNGTGKSTILQLAALAYQSPRNSLYNFQLKDFMVWNRAIELCPYQGNASVNYRIWYYDGKFEEYQRTYRVGGKNRRVVRHVEWVGIGEFLPQGERRGYLVGGNQYDCNLRATTPLQASTKQKIEYILAMSYGGLSKNDMVYTNRQSLNQLNGNLIRADHNHAHYSELNMGYGEGRTQYIVNRLEEIPERSLVLIEEPETSLHPSARYRLAVYFMDVATRRGHQIIFTTHSEELLKPLPSEGRIMLKRGGNGDVEVLQRISAAEAYCFMTDGKVRALNILVEDEVAQAVLQESIRFVAPNFLDALDFHPIGGWDSIKKTISSLAKRNLPLVGVLDGDKRNETFQTVNQQRVVIRNLYALYGTLPPEREILECQSVREYVMQTYNLNLPNFIAGCGGDHHSWFRELAIRVQRPEPALVSELAGVYVRQLPENDVQFFVEGLKESIAA